MILGESESELLTSAIDGDELALERLLLAYAPRLQRRVSKRLPASLRSVVAEDDILQETFVEAFHRIGSFEPRGKWALYRWLTTVAEHRLQNALKAARAAKRGGGQARHVGQPTDGHESMDDLLDLLAGAGRSPSQSAARHEAVMAVQVALASLKEDYRRAIKLRHIQGLSVAETAAAMHRTGDAVRNLCRRGLVELHTALGRSSQHLTRK